MASTYVHSGVSNTMMGMVVNTRMDIIHYLFDNYDADIHDMKAMLETIKDIVHYTRSDLELYFRMKSFWDKDTINAAQLFAEIKLHLALFERRALINDVIGCKWCLNEVCKILYKACIGC